MMRQSLAYVELMKNMSATDAAYLAGIVDGEGCIMINRNKAEWRHRATNDGYSLSLVVTMTDEPTIDWMLSKVGSTKREITFGQRNSLAHIRTPGYSIRITSQHCVEVLEMVLPYLICKKAEALLAIEFHRKTLIPHRGNVGITDEITALRHDYYLRMQDLKPRSIRTRLNRDLRAQGLIDPQLS